MLFQKACPAKDLKEGAARCDSCFIEQEESPAMEAESPEQLLEQSNADGRREVGWSDEPTTDLPLPSTLFFGIRGQQVRSACPKACV